MTDVALWKYRFKPDKRQEWMEWCQELNRRREEVLETLRNEGVRVEACFLSADEDCIYYFIEAESFEKAHAAFRASRYPIDGEHRRHKTGSVGEVEALQCLFHFENR
jgi:hypothetical protein